MPKKVKKHTCSKWSRNSTYKDGFTRIEWLGTIHHKISIAQVPWSNLHLKSNQGATLFLQFSCKYISLKNGYASSTVYCLRATKILILRLILYTLGNLNKNIEVFRYSRCYIRCGFYNLTLVFQSWYTTLLYVQTRHTFMQNICPNIFPRESWLTQVLFLKSVYP